MLPHQAQFAASPAHTTYLAGGWGSGKSVAGLGFIDESIALNSGLTGIIMQPTHRMLREYLQSQFIPSFRSVIASHNKTDNVFHMVDGSRVVGLSAHIPERIEMYNAAWAYLDEAGLMQRRIYERIQARVRVQAAGRLRVGITGTPHYGWLKDEFEGRDDHARRIIHVRTDANPYLHPDYYENLLASCPARLRRAYLEGHFVPPGGTVYPEFDHDVHRTAFRGDRNLRTIPSIDWSPRTPHIITAQLLPAGYSVNGRRLPLLDPRHDYAGIAIVDEDVPDGSHAALTTRDLAARVVGSPWQYGGEYTCDPAGTAAEATSGMDNVRIFTEQTGLRARYSKRTSDRLIANGIDIVKWLLEPADGIPRLYISDTVYEKAAALPQHLRPRSIVNAIMGYAYPEAKDGKPVIGNPVKDGVTDHAMDVLRYLSVIYFPSARLTVRGHVPRAA